MGRRRGKDVARGRNDIKPLKASQIRRLIAKGTEKAPEEQSAKQEVQKFVRYARVRVPDGYHHKVLECPVAQVNGTRLTEAGEAVVVVDDLGKVSLIFHEWGCDFAELDGHPIFNHKERISYQLVPGDEVILPPLEGVTKPFYGTLPDFTSLGHEVRTREVVMNPAT